MYRLAYNGDVVETRNADCGLTIKLVYRFHGQGVKGSVREHSIPFRNRIPRFRDVRRTPSFG